MTESMHCCKGVLILMFSRRHRLVCSLVSETKTTPMSFFFFMSTRLCLHFLSEAIQSFPSSHKTSNGFTHNPTILEEERKILSQVREAPKTNVRLAKKQHGSLAGKNNTTTKEKLYSTSRSALAHTNSNKSLSSTSQ